MAETRAGLCDRCAHCKRITSGRGSLFRLCALHERDPRFAKYPPLPVLTCAGYRPGDEAGGSRV